MIIWGAAAPPCPQKSAIRWPLLSLSPIYLPALFITGVAVPGVTQKIHLNVLKNDYPVFSDAPSLVRRPFPSFIEQAGMGCLIATIKTIQAECVIKVNSTLAYCFPAMVGVYLPFP